MSKIETCGLYIVNKHGKLLICHPTNHPMTFWSIPKGKVEENESYLDAALRETQEETNIEFRTYLNHFIWHYLGGTLYKSKKKTLIAFSIYEDEKSSNLDLDFDDFELKCNSIVEDRGFPENDDFKWVTFDEARILLHEAQIPNLEKIRLHYEKIKKKLNND